MDHVKNIFAIVLNILSVYPLLLPPTPPLMNSGWGKLFDIFNQVFQYLSTAVDGL